MKTQWSIGSIAIGLLIVSFGVYAQEMQMYRSSFWDYKTLYAIQERIDDYEIAFQEEELIYQLGLVTKYRERMNDDPQAVYLLDQSKEMLLAAISQVAVRTEQLEQDMLTDDENNQGESDTEQESRDLAFDPSAVSSIPPSTVSNQDEEPKASDEVEEENNDMGLSVLVSETSLDEWLVPAPVHSQTTNVAVQYTPQELLEEFSDTIDGDISPLCTIYYDQIDAIAKRNDFPTSLIIAIWYREHSCIFSNPDNGWWNFQITSHYYQPGAITWDEFATQIQNFIDFSRAKRKYYDAIQVFGPEPVMLWYDLIDVNSIRKHAILYNGVYPDVTLENSRYSNENFTQFRGGRDGIVATMLKVIQWSERRS